MRKKTNLQMFAGAEPALPKNPLPPEINYETKAYINTAPSADQPVWADLGNLTKNMSQSLNETVNQSAYYSDEGWGSSNVTGAQLTLTLTGDVKPGDEACDYLLSDAVMYHFGAARQTHLKLVKGDKVIIWPVTLANITPAHGDANNTNSLTVTIHGNGKPSIATA